MYFDNQMYPYSPVRQQIIKVNGENGARTYQMMPNSSALLLDENAPLVYLAQTDGAGYKTITAYKIEPYQPEPAPNVGDILARLQKLEERVYEQSSVRHVTQTECDIKDTKGTRSSVRRANADES